ncbi:MAG: DNA gyrase inhibitor YacG [Planctomycetota bacterium]|jgi:endogenous inhibitor of DNA gyrase (YacG/DUF329 family)
MKHSCPICKKLIIISTHSKAKESHFFPFCSHRCKLLDLGAWLDGDYQIICKNPFSNENEPVGQTQD